MLREEIRRLVTWSERHRRLVARLLLAVLLTVVVVLAGALASWLAERGAKGTDLHTFGDAVFFASVQVLTVSSSLKNPLTALGRIIDVCLELGPCSLSRPSRGRSPRSLAPATPRARSQAARPHCGPRRGWAVSAEPVAPILQCELCARVLCSVCAARVFEDR
jgi:hypothetical protein